jgi:hypothetical protein
MTGKRQFPDVPIPELRESNPLKPALHEFDDIIFQSTFCLI